MFFTRKVLRTNDLENQELLESVTLRVAVETANWLKS